MIIKKYSEFITEELTRVLSDQSGTGRTKFVDLVHDAPQDAKSLSAGVLLKKNLRDQEFQDMIDMAPVGTPTYAIKALIKKTKSTKEIDRYKKFSITINNLKFLKDMLKERGELRCEYCNKGPLVIYDISNKEMTPENILNPGFRFNTKFNSSDGATCDHKNPQSKGGAKFDYDNLAVCCETCNKRKENLTYEKWLQSNYYKRVSQNLVS